MELIDLHCPEDLKRKFLASQIQVFCNNQYAKGYPRGVMVKALDCGIVVREFVLQSRYYVHFRENTLGKGKSPLILPAMG